MSIILKHIIRNMKEHKGRSFLIFFALLVSTSVFMISLTISDDLMIKIEDTLRNIYGNAEVEVSTVDPFKLEDLKINNTEYTYIGLNNFEGVTEKDKNVSIYGLDIKKAVEFKLLGEDASELEKNEILVSDKIAQDKNYHKNDIIKIKNNNKIYSLTIKDIIDSKGLASIRPDADMDFDIFFTSTETLNEIANLKNDYYDRIYFNIKNDDDINKFVEYLKDNNKNYIINKTVDMDSIKETTSMISAIMYLIVVMATIMIYFVINSLNKIILAERIPVIGTFRSVGASRRKMNFILILENAIYGIFAGIFGAILGTYLNSMCSNAFVTTSGVDLSRKSLNITPGSIVIGIIFATLLQVFITTKEIIRTNKKPIKVLIFNTQNSRYRLRKRRTIIGFILLIISLLIFFLCKNLSLGLVALCLIGFMIGVANTLPVFIQSLSRLLTKIFKKIGFTTGIIATKNITNNKMIIASSRLVVIAISLLSSIILMSSAITRAFSNFRVVTKGIDIMVEGMSNNSEYYSYLEDIKGVKKVDSLNSFFINNVTYNNKKKFSITPGFYAEKERKTNIIEEIDYKIKDLKEDEILVDEQYALRNSFKVGDTIKINYEDLEKSYTYKIVGLVDASNFNVSRNMIVVSYKHLINDLNGIPMQLHITCDKNVNLEKMKDKIKDNIKEVGIKVETTDEYITEQENQIASITSIIYIVIGISVLLSFVGIINNQIIGFISRKKELAILNSTCMTRTQIKKMLAFETILANLIALIIAIIISAITVLFMNNCLNGIGFYLNIKFELAVIIKFVVIVYIILLLTLLVPFRKLRKMNIIEEIKYE